MRPNPTERFDQEMADLGMQDEMLFDQALEDNLNADDLLLEEEQDMRDENMGSYGNEVDVMDIPDDYPGEQDSQSTPYKSNSFANVVSNEEFYPSPSKVNSNSETNFNSVVERPANRIGQGTIGGGTQ
jgi:hypothetical protein